ncbi:hypothetical protein [Natronorubrum halophilum]|uniref:hypothetical protein n=1 Tax=Natronorubrum halophilum TaxID=1702106 RepID=UPI0010C235B0|nr:hypothetical protein [Natronorubrum halophilum]
MSADEPNVEHIEAETTNTVTWSDDERRADQYEARAERLAEENRRLRIQYANARRADFRRAAILFVGLGLVAAIAGIAFENTRDVLFALAGTGLFAAVLTSYLVPGQFVAAEIGERVYTSLADTLAAVAAELGLREERLYVPTDDETPSARLFVPLEADPEIPSPRSGPVVTEDDSRGLVLQPTGGELFREFRNTLSEDLTGAPEQLASQLAAGVVEQFELAAVVDPEVDVDGGRITFGIADSTFGDVDRLDHPIASFLGCGVAIGLDRVVSLEVTDGGSRYDWLVTCRWDVEES